MSQKKRTWYTEREWFRDVGWGVVPEEYQKNYTEPEQSEPEQLEPEQLELFDEHRKKIDAKNGGCTPSSIRKS